jgi:ATP-dependent DNA helicase RecQ
MACLGFQLRNPLWQSASIIGNLHWLWVENNLRRAPGSLPYWVPKPVDLHAEINLNHACAFYCTLTNPVLYNRAMLEPPQPADMVYERAKEILAAHFGYADFRPAQQGVVRRILAGERILAVMPTGGGKSICYQVPALVRPGLAIIVSPLIALMKDQVDALAQRGLSAAAFHSGLKAAEQRQVREGLANQTIKFLYLAPERFNDDEFIALLRQNPIGLLAVDEAHCISQWGHDFRPSYQRLNGAIKKLGDPQVIALTATATPGVRADIQRQLGIPPHHLIAAGFDRPNLRYMARACHTAAERKEHLIGLARRLEGTGIVYAPTRRATEDTARLLSESGIETNCYHAGLPGKVRLEAQEDWLSGKYRLIAATNAFGMGIDKPNVRFVLHYQSPGSLEAYYQEAGRAGRDGLTSYAVLLFGESDRRIHERFLQSRFPSRPIIEAVYRSIKQRPAADATELTARLPSRWGEPPLRRALKLLSEAGLIEDVSQKDKGAPGIRIKGSGRDSSRLPLDWEGLEEGLRQELTRLDAMLAYGPTTECRRNAVLRYFGEEVTDEFCTGCDNCLAWGGKPPQAPPTDGSAEFAILSAVADLGERFGETTIAAYLTGGRTRQAERFQFHKMPGYGCL